MRLRAVYFDFGGTLDAPGIHWLERFAALYAQAGCHLSWEQIRAAFDHATRCAYQEPQVRTMTLEPLIQFHVGKQFVYLGLRDHALAERLQGDFVAAARASLVDSRAALSRLGRCYDLGVISNFYGNVGHLLEEAGILPFLSVVIDSTLVGLRKPDPAIFRLALEKLECAPEDALYVGDSFDKDIIGAHQAGLRTAWLSNRTEGECPDPSLVDFRIRSIAELESVLPKDP